MSHPTLVCHPTLVYVPPLVFGSSEYTTENYVLLTHALISDGEVMEHVEIDFAFILNSMAPGGMW